MQIKFEKGIPGFEYLHDFELVNLEENEKFKVLQSTKDEVSFIATCPFEIYENYEIDLSDEVIKELSIECQEDVLILGIITLGKSLETSTINLKAPIVINIKNGQARQFILQTEVYETKHPLIRSEKNVSNY